jgi:hypothetical protein
VAHHGGELTESSPSCMKPTRSSSTQSLVCRSRHLEAGSACVLVLVSAKRLLSVGGRRVLTAGFDLGSTLYSLHTSSRAACAVCTTWGARVPQWGDSVNKAPLGSELRHAPLPRCCVLRAQAAEVHSWVSAFARGAAECGAETRGRPI